MSDVKQGPKQASLKSKATGKQVLGKASVNKHVLASTTVKQQDTRDRLPANIQDLGRPNGGSGIGGMLSFSGAVVPALLRSLFRAQLRPTWRLNL